MKLQWRSDPELSAVRAAYIVATGMPCIDEQVERSLLTVVNEINHRLVSSAIDNARFWTSFLDRSAAGDACETAVSLSLIRAGCSELQLEQAAKGILSRINDARALFFQRFPKLDDQLPLRLRPLRDRFETVGPGLLREVERQVWQNSPPPDWWPPSVTVSGVQPLSGGSGGFDPDGDSIWIEAMLTDNDPHIPEVLRVVWLITSLAIETHIRSRTGQRMISTAWSLVSVPLVLSAAMELDVLPPSRSPTPELPIDRAVQMWHGGSSTITSVLSHWWQDYSQSETPLPLALKQLEKQLKQAADSK